MITEIWSKVADFAHRRRDDIFWSIMDRRAFVEKLKHIEDHKLSGDFRLANGSLCYFREGVLSRDDGPAVSFPDGREEYWLDGMRTKLFRP